MKPLFLYILFFLLFFSQHSLQSQQRPKVGLVLSGGAAHGLAHIGVIKYLEELGIEVDYITGTSMGSVVGGLNAMGFDSDQLRDVAKGQNWNLLMSNRTPLYEVAPIEKEHHERIPLSIYWNEDAFNLPQGLIRGQKLDIILSNIFAPGYLTREFDQFHIPFKCVAVDIENGAITVFDKGYIGDAIRASMAIPSVFPPSEIGENLFVDGGLIRNFPVQECIDMGADYIIGVYVGIEKSNKDELKSMFDILRQSASMGSILDSEMQMKLADLVIHPEVKDMGKFDFDDYDAFIKKGYDAAREYEDVLKDLADKLKESEAPKKNPKLDYALKIKIDTLIIEEQDKVLRKMIQSELGFSKGHYVSLQDLEESLSLIFGTKNFSKASYSFDYSNKRPGLKILTKEVNPYSIGLSLNRFKHFNASLIINAEARNILSKPSNFRMDLRISENPGMQGEYYLRLPKVPSFLFRLKGKYELYNFPLFNNGVVDRLYKTREGRARIEVLKELKNVMLFSVGMEYRFDGIRPEVFKEEDLKIYNTRKLALNLGFNYNSLDRQIFPEKGVALEAYLGHVFNNKLRRENQSEETEFLSLTEDRRYSFASLSFEGYYHYADWLCSEFRVNGHISTGISFLDNYKLGGPLQSKERVYGFLGVDGSELLVDNHISGKLGFRIHVSEVVYLTPGVQYLYGRNLASYAFDNIDEDISLFSYGLVLGINSPIGPIIMDMGYSELREKLVINLGIGYRHIF
ncbi:MAG: BamA/TamA family outer membrane protein [Saprospiraceae bacterium]|nr:BamA/TamA family outer membrane protein [Saprospiraceae bacterium]